MSESAKQMFKVIKIFDAFDIIIDLEIVYILSIMLDIFNFINTIKDFFVNQVFEFRRWLVIRFLYKGSES